MKAIKTLAATGALLISFSSFAASDLARQLHVSDGYNASDITAVTAAKSGGPVDREFVRKLSQSDGTIEYGYAPAPSATAGASKPSVGFDAELLKELRKTDGNSA
ncbi:MAG TPA: hypothetical protein VLW45_11845 [Pelomicrobium sp.]|nr:hypothetical protein [Pelomicrobium sp.]